MKCIAETSRWGKKACPNNAKCDGYCYAHHPSVVLAKLRLYARAGRGVPSYMDPDLKEAIRKQEELLAKITLT